jgi:hypothetical protein
MTVRKAVLQHLNAMELGLLLVGCKNSGDVSGYETVLEHIKASKQDFGTFGVFGGTKACADLPHRSTKQIAIDWALDYSAYVNPTVCGCCGTTVGIDVKMVVNKKEIASLAICHKVPSSRGGATIPANVFVGCAVCNKNASNKIDAELEAILSAE